MNIYPEYERGTKRNNRFNNNDNKNNYYLPNIYQNKIKSSYRRTRVKKKCNSKVNTQIKYTH